MGFNGQKTLKGKFVFSWKGYMGIPGVAKKTKPTTDSVKFDTEDHNPSISHSPVLTMAQSGPGLLFWARKCTVYFRAQIHPSICWLEQPRVILKEWNSHPVMIYLHIYKYSIAIHKRDFFFPMRSADVQAPNDAIFGRWAMGKKIQFI